MVIKAWEEGEIALKTEYPLVSVVIPCHNYEGFLPEAVKSACGQTYGNVEVLVVDDDSDSYGAFNVAMDFGVRYARVDHRGELTPAHAHNEGLKLARGEFVVFLSADDWMSCEYVERCVAKFMWETEVRGRRVGFVWTGCQVFGAASDMRVPYRRVLKHSWDGYANPGGQLGAMLVPSSVYAAVGGYDVSLSGREDWDWVIRCLRAGFSGVSLSRPLLYVRSHGGNLTKHVKDDLFKRYPLIRVFNLPVRLRRNVHAALQKF